MKKRWLKYGLLLGLFLAYLFKDSYDSLVLLINHNFDYLSQANVVYENIQKEQNSLQKLLGIKENLDYNFIPTKIKYRDILDFKDTLEIYKGSLEGIKKGSVVLNELGVVGVIKSVSQHSATVELITNKNSQISVRINNAYGILKYRDNKLIVSNLTNLDTVNENDKIFTSGIGNLPGGLYIGEVQEISLDKLEIEKIITVKNTVDFNDLIYLVVIT